MNIYTGAVPAGAPAEEPAAAPGGVTVAQVKLTIALDEEWRSGFGTNARSVANNAIERADDKMYEKFGIDLYSSTYVNWSTPSARTSMCKSSTTGKLQHLASTFASPSGSDDFVVGFSKQDFDRTTGPGCAYINGRHAVVNNSDANWQVFQHEASHIFGAPDRYVGSAVGGDPNHPDDVMEDPYNHPDYWCTTPGYNDHGIVNGNAARFN